MPGPQAMLMLNSLLVAPQPGQRRFAAAIIKELEQRDALLAEVAKLRESADELATLLEGARIGKPDLREMERALAKHYGEWIK